MENQKIIFRWPDGQVHMVGAWHGSVSVTMSALKAELHKDGATYHDSAFKLST
jgi:hypothetical protein